LKDTFFRQEMACQKRRLDWLKHGKPQKVLLFNAKGDMAKDRNFYLLKQIGLFEPEAYHKDTFCAQNSKFANRI
jgi:hypothetical protein